MSKTIESKIPIIFQSLNNYESTNNDIRFQKVKIWLMHLGENYNGSYFSRSVVEAAIPTLANTPILAYIENKNGGKDFSDHRAVIVQENGETVYKYLGKAIGVIAQDNNAQFEERLCDDGVTRTFLTVEGLLWTKFDDPIDIMNRDSVKGQSMELSSDYDGDFQDDGFFHFSKFSFYGACGLGVNVEPAMKNATIELVFSADSFKDEINLMMEQFKKYTSSVPTEEGININKKEDEVVANKSKLEIATQFSLTINQLYEEMSRALSELKYETTNWYGEEVEVSRFYLRDFDEQFAYVVDRQNDYIDVKIAYSMSGDNVTFDDTTVKRIKYVPTDWEGEAVQEGEVEQNFSVTLVEEFKEVVAQFISKEVELTKQVSDKEEAILSLNGQFTSVQSQLSEKEKEVESLVEFKKQIEGDQRKEKVDALFSTYSVHLTKEEIEEFRSKEPTFEKLDEFEKEIKSFVCDKVIVNVKKDTAPTFSKMGIPPQNDDTIAESNNIWDKLDNKNKK